MNIEALAEIFHDDSNGLITSISRSEKNELLISIECDDWKNSRIRREFTMVCKQWLDTDVCICSANAISVYREHPLLLNRSGRQGSLYFSSCPQDPYQIYAHIWEILHHHYKGWLAASRMMPDSPASFHTLLTGGYGLLLRGPISVLTSVRDRIGSDLKTQLIETHIVETSAVVLEIGNHFVICEEIEVIDHNV
ncbi:MULTISPECIES: hypothetical protein [Delftia]|uniref:hypothetical protein n=1 Tax=Delftia TaxID=80865 RepID=UPI0012D2D2AE|nr:MULTISPECIES: hypothetical protein [Delftia]MBJ2140616.1 hypothetical protein [Delftia acidovorans]MCB4787415.1 hypothetical protein [Delftia sp. Lp-1]QQB52514.1 hypothetical protein I6H54_09745 [Delftia acidovorans]